MNEEHNLVNQFQKLTL